MIYQDCYQDIYRDTPGCGMGLSSLLNVATCRSGSR